MSTDNSYRAIHADGREPRRVLRADRNPFRGGWRVVPASSIAFSHKSMWGLLTPRGTFTGITARLARPDHSHLFIALDAAMSRTKT
jgi:hypothetical protein